jgi:hypothetical protein
MSAEDTLKTLNDLLASDKDIVLDSRQKELVVFWLKRQLKKLEQSHEVDHEKLASDRVPYDQRQVLIKKAEGDQHEILAFRLGIRFIEEKA